MTQALSKRKAEPDTTPDLIAMAIEKGMDADALTKLVDLVERRERLAAEQAFTAAMQQAQADMPVVVRDAENSQTHSTYATLEEIQRTIKPIYTTHGFALSFAEADAPIAGWKRTICDLRHVKGHTARYHVDLPLDGVGAKGNAIGAMNPVQAAVSTGSYGQRVLLCRMFNLTIADSDVDGQSLNDLLGLTEEQRNEVKDLIEVNNIEVPKLLKWLKAESVETLTRHQYRKLVATYRERKGGAVS